MNNILKNQIKSNIYNPGADIDSNHNLVMIKSELEFNSLDKPKKDAGHKWKSIISHLK